MKIKKSVFFKKIPGKGIEHRYEVREIVVVGTNYYR